MSELILKYNLLNTTAQQQVQDFIDFLLTKNKKQQPKNHQNYKQKILQVSVWDDADLQHLEAAQKTMTQWTMQEW